MCCNIGLWLAFFCFDLISVLLYKSRFILLPVIEILKEKVKLFNDQFIKFTSFAFHELDMIQVLVQNFIVNKSRTLQIDK